MAKGGHSLDTKEVISFRKLIPHASSDSLHERVKAPGTVEGVFVRFYSGQQLALRVTPMVVHKLGLNESLVTYAKTGDGFLSGDDDRLDFPVVISVDTDDYITINVVNTDAVNDYNLVVDVVVDYYGGKQRVVGGVL